MLFANICALMMCGCAVDGGSGTEPEGIVSIAYLKSLCIDRSVAITKDFVIEGRVTANDRMGELKQMFVVEDDTAGVIVEVECDDINSLIPLYSKVSIRCSGLNIGRVGNNFLLGTPPTGDYVVNRIERRSLYNYVSVDLSPTEPAEPMLCSIGDVSLGHVSKYVRIERVQFIDEEQGMMLCDVVDEDYVNSIRHITDGCDTLRVVTSATTRYAGMTLPEGELRCCGVIEWYEDDLALRIINRHIQSM